MTNIQGMLITTVWFVVFAVYLYLSDIGNLQPNTLGDFLAGVCAPMAFFWLILTYKQQWSK